MRIPDGRGIQAPQLTAMALSGPLHAAGGVPIRSTHKRDDNEPCNPHDTSVSGFAVTGARRWTSAPATTTAISTSALRRSTSTQTCSASMAGSRSRSLTLLISVDALPSAATRSGSQRKSGAGAAPMAWRPLYYPDAGPLWRRVAAELHRNSGSCCERASSGASQLLRRWKCAYTQAHQDSATIEGAAGPPRKATALSFSNDSAVTRERCHLGLVAIVKRWETMLRGFQTIFM
jgi:hypothetical protein